MKQPKSIQISIPTPCHEDWNKMTPQEQGRFCSSCQKCVVDFTGFTDEQLYTYLLAHKNERICGRVRTSQTNRAIQLPAQPHSTLYKWVIAAGLVLLFTAAPESKTFAQAPLIEQTTPSLTTPQNKDNNNDSTGKIEGVVLDENGEPIYGAVVQVFKDDIVIGGAVSDIDGKFSITNLKHGMYDLSTIYIGYTESWITKIIVNGNTIANVKLEPSNRIMAGEIIYVEYNPPLINQNDGGGIKTITSEELEKGAY